jgi:hypothetical protein
VGANPQAVGKRKHQYRPRKSNPSWNPRKAFEIEVDRLFDEGIRVRNAEHLVQLLDGGIWSGKTGLAPCPSCWAVTVIREPAEARITIWCSNGCRTREIFEGCRIRGIYLELSWPADEYPGEL